MTALGQAEPRRLRDRRRHGARRERGERASRGWHRLAEAIDSGGGRLLRIHGSKSGNTAGHTHVIHCGRGATMREREVGDDNMDPCVGDWKKVRV